MLSEQTLLPSSKPLKENLGELIPTATIVYHPDMQRIGEQAPLRNLLKNSSQEISRLTPEFSPASPSVSERQPRNLGDPYVSRTPVKLSVINGRLQIKKPPDVTGNISVNGCLLVDEIFLINEEWHRGFVISLFNRVVLSINYLPAKTEQSTDNHGLLGESVAVQQIRKTINKVADLNVPVLIRGETGTGKELVAQAVHNSSQQQQQAFISVNVAAIPDTLAISELFGTKKGGFTGASKDRAGYFQQADQGTLFLDEIGDAPHQVQVALLRTLETGEITPVGANEPTRVSVRLLAATDADLEKHVDNDAFRNPLLQRLSGFEIHIPPLRKRREDIGRLLSYFIGSMQKEVNNQQHLEDSPHNISFWAGLFTKAYLYEWPGNIRQLKNIAQQIVIYNRDADFLTLPEHINKIFSPTSNPTPKPHLTTNTEDSIQQETPVATESSVTRRKPSTVTEQELIAVLEQQRWDIKGTAEQLNISRAALYKIIDNTASVRTASDYCVEELKASFQRCAGNLELMVDELKVSRAALKRRLKDLRIDL